MVAVSDKRKGLHGTWRQMFSFCGWSRPRCPSRQIDCVFKIDRTPAIFRLSQGGGNVWHLDEAKVHDDLPKPLGEFRQLDALARHDVRDILEIHRQRDYGS